MSPTPATPPPVPTQVRRPWRATVRTLVAAAVAIASIAPWIYQGATLHDPSEATGLVGQVLAVCAAVTRVLALPQVETFLRKFKLTSWLSAAPTLGH